MRNPLLLDTETSAIPSVLAAHYLRVRTATQQLCVGLLPEDTVAQSMPDASPTKWHLAHTSWFFEQFALSRDPRFQAQSVSQPQWMVLFNSYYQSVGPQFSRAQRGLLTRPSLAEVLQYRERVDAAMLDLMERDQSEELNYIVQLGLNHEQQHQELLLTDIKHLFSLNPLEPVYRAAGSSNSSASGDNNRSADPAAERPALALQYLQGRSGIAAVGHQGKSFAYDSEGPRHRVLLSAHAIANRPVNNAEYLEFIKDGAYQNPQLWLAEGWDTVQRQGWTRPLYWAEDLASAFTLRGRQTLDPLAPVCHISFFEADAFARWAGVRLPTEFEWESLAENEPVDAGNFVDSGALHPQPPVQISRQVRSSETAAGKQPEPGSAAPLQLFGDVWEWTASPYINYPGFRPGAGALGEYNGKFMSGKWVLRGGSCVTPAQHIRASYRNYFHSADRWQFSGLRLAKDL